jgi:pimeloyl-ACP methyl ester carboxylesterase
MTNGQTRRTALGAMAASVGVAGVGLMAMTDQTTAQAQTGGKTFVLVHGAWHGGWCWRRVSDLLEKKGHKVFAPTMTGLGERSHLIGGKIDLATHVTDIVNVIKWESLNDIVLVGHSYGGVVISGVAEQMREAIGSIVFLDAFLPANGDSLATKASQPVREAIAGLVEKGETAMKPVPAAVFRVNEKDRAWVDAMCTPQPLGTFTDKITTASPRRPISAPRVIRACRSTASTTGSRPTAHGASTSCPAATTPWSTCPTGSRRFCSRWRSNQHAPAHKDRYRHTLWVPGLAELARDTSQRYSVAEKPVAFTIFAQRSNC